MLHFASSHHRKGIPATWSRCRSLPTQLSLEFLDRHSHESRRIFQIDAMLELGFGVPFAGIVVENQSALLAMAQQRVIERGRITDLRQTLLSGLGSRHSTEVEIQEAGHEAAKEFLTQSSEPCLGREIMDG